MNVGNINNNIVFEFFGNTNRTVHNIEFQNNTQEIAVTLDISKEGKDRLKNEMINNTPFSYEHFQKQKHYLSNIAMDSSGKFEAGINKLWNNNICNEQDWVNSCVDTYKDLYNEIVSGYTNGTREKYVSDENSEDGFRQLTMEEELQKLNDEYSQECDFLETFFTQCEKDHKALIEWAKLVDTIKKDSSQSMYKAMVSSYEEFKSKKVPGGIRNAMMNAVSFLRNPSINVVV